MEKTPLISVIVPVYNLQDYLEKSLDALWNQTYQNFEVICVNDGSKDNSLQLLKKIANKHSNMMVIDKKNGGVSSARNKGLEFAQGEYIYFLDADDIMHPQLLEILVSQIQKYDADVACCGYTKTVDLNKIIFSDYQDYDTKIDQFPFKTFIEKEENYSYCLWTKLYKHVVLDKMTFIENIHYGEDMLFNLDVFSRIKKAVKVNLPLYFYIERSSSCVNTSFNEKKAQSFINLIKEIHAKFSQHQEYPLIKRNISSLSMKFLIKKIYNTPMYRVYQSDILALYKMRAFDILSLGWKNFLRIMFWGVRGR